MNEYIRKKLQENKKENIYLRENSNWYKTLNRDPSSLSRMTNEMKDRYGLRFTNKLENVNNILEILSMLKENDN